MSRLFQVPAIIGGVQSPPWHCQLIHAQLVDDRAVLDLVALEPAPGGACPRATPFTLHIGCDGVARHALLATLAAWSAGAGLVRIVSGVTGDAQWLCMSSGEQHVILGSPGMPNRCPP